MVTVARSRRSSRSPRSLRALAAASSSTLCENSREASIEAKSASKTLRGSSADPRTFVTSPRSERPFSRTRTRTMSPASAPRLSLRATKTGRRSSTNKGSATEYFPRRTSWAGRIMAKEEFVGYYVRTPAESTTGRTLLGRSSGLLHLQEAAHGEVAAGDTDKDTGG